MTTANTNIATISIGTGAVRQKGGLYCLNDLHKLSGGNPNHRPSKFMRNQQTKDLIEQIEQSPNLGFGENLATKAYHGGINRGTYVCKELVYAYAMWVSPAFTLMVIRAFDAMQSSNNLPPILLRHYQAGI